MGGENSPISPPLDPRLLTYSNRKLYNNQSYDKPRQSKSTRFWGTLPGANFKSCVVHAKFEKAQKLLISTKKNLEWVREVISE